MPLRGGTATIAPDPHVIQRTRTHFSRDSSKAAEDRHIGFRWLAREARLPGERDAEEVFRAVAAELGECIGGDEARHLASHLPLLGQRLIWEEETRRDGRPHFLELDELVHRLQWRLGLTSRAFLRGAAWLIALAACFGLLARLGARRLVV